MHKFWPRHSPNFMACRVAVRTVQPRDITVGLSGGADSLALVAALCAEDYNVHALCVDHRLQPGSHEVAQQAAHHAQTFGAHAEIISVTVAPGNLEANARTARYHALHSRNLPVVVGHTADDQAETLLLGALRGKATGMQIHTDNLWRPLLGVRRATTLAACAELGIEPWHDPHNANTDFLRVALRTQVVPLLSDIIGGDAVPALSQAATLIAEDTHALHVDTPDDRIAQLAGMPPALRRRHLVALLQAYGARVSAAHLRAVDALITNWHGQKAVPVGNGLEVTRKDGRLSVS